MRRALLLALSLALLPGCRVLWGTAASAVVVIEEACDVLAPLDPRATKICADVRDLEAIVTKILAWKARKTSKPTALYEAAPHKRDQALPAASTPGPITPPRPIVIELPEGMTAADLDRM